VRCAGMAILDGRGEAVAAVSISGPSFRVTMQKIPSIAGKLMACVKGIQHDLGFIPFAR
jgi:DNA-binding IclR family transcriptional regulator